MLRISESASADGTASFRLEGSVTGPWVAELKRSCDAWLAKGCRLTLDLGEVSFVGREGIVLLRELVSREATLVNCPLFLAEQLRQAVR